MSLRFRRSISIIPGVRLNVGLRGLSATVGPRGASVNIGQRGVYGNIGIPGTGLSVRERLDSPSGLSPARDSYRMTLRQIRDMERAAAMESAAAEHEAAQARLNNLRGVLSGRNRQAYDWQSVWASAGEYKPNSFKDPLPGLSIADSKDAATRAFPLAGWFLPIAGVLLFSVIYGSVIVRVIAAVLFLLMGVWVIRVIRERQIWAEAQFKKQSALLAADLPQLREAHNAAEEAAKQKWDEEERIRERVRTAIERKDLETISQVLEAELNDEALPLPFVFDLELESVTQAQIELTLPELQDVPEEVTSLTQRGRLSRKAMTQHDRADVYADLCASFALRLMYESFRVVPSFESVEMVGSIHGIDQSTGHQKEFVVLRLKTTRQNLSSLNLDNVDASAALTALGGVMSLDRKGNPIPLR